MIDYVARFWTKVDIRGEDDCWNWTDAVKASGYAHFWDGTKQVRAHRFIYAATVGEIPENHDIHHTCENRKCQNPRHLRPKKKSDHGRDHNRMAKVWAEKTHCPQGHEYTTENTIAYRGKRFCRECRNDRNREYMRRRNERLNRIGR